MKLFLFGGLVWAAAIVVKIVMELTLFIPLNSLLSSIYTPFGLVFIWGLILGLRTGYLECGFTYLGAKKKLKAASFDEATAFGIGFGGAEAVVLGFGSFMSVMVFIAFPEVLEAMPEAQRSTILKSFQDPVVIPAPILERFFILMVHLLSALMIIYAIRARRAEYFVLSFMYKSSIDGLLPWMWRSFDLTKPSDLYAVEAIVALFGIVGTLGSLWMIKKFKALPEVRPRLKLSHSLIIIVVVTIFLFGLSGLFLS